MKTLLTLAGYTPYQAACMAPVMWMFLIGMVGYGVIMNPRAAVILKRIWKEVLKNVSHNVG